MSQELTRTQWFGSAFGVYTIMFMVWVVQQDVVGSWPLINQPLEIQVFGLVTFGIIAILAIVSARLLGYAMYGGAPISIID